MAKKRVKAGTSRQAAEDKRKAFVEAYLSNGGNATQAAITAGFSPKTAGVTGAKCLKDPRISSILANRQAEIAKTTELSTERLALEMRRISFSDPRKVFHPDGGIKLPHELDDDTAAAIASFKFDVDGNIEYKFWDKPKNIDMCNKIVGHYERDNKQKTDPLRDLLGALGGKILGVSRVADDEVT
jgi:phage terminase small subunit